jgi:hypothetical protein
MDQEQDQAPVSPAVDAIVKIASYLVANAETVDSISIIAVAKKRSAGFPGLSKADAPAGPVINFTINGHLDEMVILFDAFIQVMGDINPEAVKLSMDRRIHAKKMREDKSQTLLLPGGVKHVCGGDN